MKNIFIDSYISAFTYSAIKGRGRNLLKSNKVISAIKKKNNTFEFKVKGSIENYYNVQVKNPDNADITTSCNCIYAREEGVCKHQVAALLYIEEERPIHDLGEVISHKSRPTKKADKSKLVPKRNAADELILHEFNPITESILLNVEPDKETDYYEYEFRFVKYTHKQIYFKVGKEKRYYWENINFEDVKINSKKDGSIGIKCSCSQTIPENQLCEHGYALLEFFENNGNGKYLQYLEKEAKELIQKEIAKNNNYTLEIVKKHIDYRIVEDGIQIVKKKGSEGLIFDNNWGERNIQNILSGIDDTSQIENLVPAMVQQSEFAFSIAFNFNYWDEIDVHPLTAKTNKNRSALASTFKVFHSFFGESSFPYEYEKTYPEIFKLLERFKVQTALKVKHQLNNNDIFVMLKSLFEHSSTLPYPVYYFFDTKNGKVPRKYLNEVTLSDSRVVVKFKLTKEKLVYLLQVIIVIDDEEIALDTDSISGYYINRFVVLNKNKLHLFKSVKHQKILESFSDYPNIMVPIKDYNKLHTKFIIPLLEHFDVDLSEIEEIVSSNESVKPIAKQIYLKESDGHIMFIPKVVFDNNAVVELLSDEMYFEGERGLEAYDRDLEFEENFTNVVEALHPDFKDQRDLGVYFLEFNQMMENHWFLDAFDEMRKHGIKIFGLNELTKFKYSTHRASVSMNIKSGEDWFDVDLKVSFGDYMLSISELKKIASSDDRYLELGDGSIGILPKEWLEKIKRMFHYSDKATNSGMKISKMKFSLIDELFEELDETEILEEIAAKKEKLLTFKEISNVKVPKQIKAELRPYQKEGLNWLNFLDENSWGGILADDMGLGKTLQILSFLQHHININKEDTHLIVLPTTLVFNWEDEIEKFTKSIKTHFHVGGNRERNTDKFSKHNIVITTYGVLLNDIEFLKDYKFNYVILDESQAIKNPQSKRYKAAVLLKAKNRIALTGTPIENNTFDLYAQMNFVNPGFLGSQLSFKNEYSLPIDRDRNDERAKDLHKLIKPFLLRRTKEQVATELPPKIEDVLYCEMESEQMKVYEAYRNKYRDFLMGKFDDQGLNKSKMYVLEGLTKLRQICDSPMLLSGDEVYTSESAKIKVLLNHIEEKTNNHKILVFSQFVKMLGLVKKELDRRNITYEYLDGKSSVKQRKESVGNFQNDDNIRVFLISLKAGGTGLNLTAADYVYILDPWWNPAVENQAIDRAYRIGQDKKVIAYRMISKNTIEEKIMKIQSKKKKIAVDIIQTDDSVFKELSQDDIMDLFK